MIERKIIYPIESIFIFAVVLLFSTFAYALTPEIHSIEPDNGTNTSLTDITILGDNFDAVPRVELFGGGPNIIGSIVTLGLARDVYVSGNYAYVVSGSGGLQVLRTSDPCDSITFVNATTLTASVPAGLPAGTYNLHVVNPTGERDILHNAYTVSEVSNPPIIDDIDYNGCISELCTTTLAASAHDPAGGVLIYEWDQFDDSTVDGRGESFVFDPPGPSVLPGCVPYLIKLTVTSELSGLTAEQTAQVTVKIAGDANGDGIVNILDKVAVRNAFGSSGDFPGDVDCDGIVSIIDKVIVRNQFGKTGCACP